MAKDPIQPGDWIRFKFEKKVYKLGSDWYFYLNGTEKVSGTGDPVQTPQWWSEDNSYDFLEDPFDRWVKTVREGRLQNNS